MEHEGRTMMWTIGLIAIAAVIITVAKVSFPALLDSIFAWMANQLDSITIGG